jgi:hypothetical protein
MWAEYQRAQIEFVAESIKLKSLASPCTVVCRPVSDIPLPMELSHGSGRNGRARGSWQESAKESSVVVNIQLVY